VDNHQIHGRWVNKPLLAIILAGGRGTRLRVLTEERCKPEVPVGKNRFIDFALANVVNSQIVNHTMILTQYMQQGLINHLGRFQLNAPMWGKFVDIVPAQQRLGDGEWYLGSANAVYQNHESIRCDQADTVVILAADHLYKLDIRQFLAYHHEKKAVFTVCGMVMPSSEASENFGVMELDADGRILGFEEKPAKPKSLPGREGMCFASMGIYIVDKEFLLQILEEDHSHPGSEHDFGKDIVPRLCKKKMAIYGYDYNENFIPGEVRSIDGVEVAVHYWRDVGKIAAYWQAVMDLVVVDPLLNIYNPLWPVPTAWDMLPPAKSIYPDRDGCRREFVTDGMGTYLPDSICGGGCIFDSPKDFYKVVFGRSVRTEYGAELMHSIVLDNTRIGARAVLTHTIVEEGVVVPKGVRVGFDLVEDEANGVYIDEDHNPNSPHPPIRVITRNTHWQQKKV
jgi:glucose-1-phosphate adenylyltransferase